LLNGLTDGLGHVLACLSDIDQPKDIFHEGNFLIERGCWKYVGK